MLGIEILEFRDLAENNNQAPINPKIIKIEENVNENSRSFAMCSETEVTNGSCELKNGFSAFRYLKDISWERTGIPCSSFSINDKTPEKIIPIVETITAPNTKIEFLIRVDSLLNL